MDTIGIIGAMEEEIELLKQRLGDYEITSRGGNTFFIGELHNSRIILLKSGIGKVNAAIGTTLLISQYHPMCIINTGSAGAVFKDLNIGDVVISTDVVHHDVDVTAFGYEFGQVPQMPHSFLPGDDLVTMAEQAGNKLDGIHVRRAGIATGDSFMNDQEKITAIRERFPTTAAVEMEAAAIAQTCHQFSKPFVSSVPFRTMRTKGHRSLSRPSLKPQPTIRQRWCSRLFTACGTMSTKKNPDVLRKPCSQS